LTSTQFQIGIDENGLGPRLGPMVVTAVCIELDRTKVPDHKTLVEKAVRARIADSKTSSAHGAMGSAEGHVLAILQQHLGWSHQHFSSLFEQLALDSQTTLKAHCPAGEAPTICFSDPVALPVFGPGVTPEDRSRAKELMTEGVSLRSVRVGIACAKSMNLARAKGRSRFDLDLELMVRLAGSFGSVTNGQQVTVVCGKVGGRSKYASALQDLSPLVGVLAEKRERSSYTVPRLGDVHFVLDGDATEPAIGLASQIGKYIRELWMHRINRYWISAVPGLNPVSGYHDPVTEKMIEATQLVRKTRAIPDECFQR
jgi:ribonuclease HII